MDVIVYHRYALSLVRVFQLKDDMHNHLERQRAWKEERIQVRNSLSLRFTSFGRIVSSLPSLGSQFVLRLAT